jgi:hypothetical protein
MSVSCIWINSRRKDKSIRQRKALKKLDVQITYIHTYKHAYIYISLKKITISCLNFKTIEGTVHPRK